MALVHLRELECRIGGSGLGSLVWGWSTPESGSVWAINSRSHVEIEVEETHPSYLVVLAMSPIAKPQKVSFWSQGRFLQTSPVRKGVAVSVVVPRALVRDGRIQLTLAHYDGVDVSTLIGGTDVRVLSVEISRLSLYGMSGLPAESEPRQGAELAPDRLFGRFQSLGDTCEFGFCQRTHGAEPLQLLRFAGIGLAQLLLGVASGFRDLASLEHISYWMSGRVGDAEEDLEYMVRHDIYGLNSHSFRSRRSISGEDFRLETQKRLQLLQRMILEDMEDAEKIFVLKRNEDLTPQEVAPVWACLRGHGDNTLLYVVPAAGDRLPGSVEWTAPGLLCGYIDRFAPERDIHDISDQCWLSICRNAHALWQAQRDAAEAQ